jgi:hypothetical protein
MRELLLIDVAMCAAVIVVAAVVLIMLRRRGGDQTLLPVAERRGAVAELADGGMSGEVADVRGFSHDTKERDLGITVPAGPRQAAESPVSGVADPDPVSGAADPDPVSGAADPDPVSGAADPDPGSTGLGTEPDEPPAAAGAVTMSERIGAYYEEADRPVADYLASRGWTEEQGKPGREKDAGVAPAPEQATAEPGTARKQLAA